MCGMVGLLRYQGMSAASIRCGGRVAARGLRRVPVPGSIEQERVDLLRVVAREHVVEPGHAERYQCAAEHDGLEYLDGPDPSTEPRQVRRDRGYAQRVALGAPSVEERTPRLDLRLGAVPRRRLRIRLRDPRGR